MQTALVAMCVAALMVYAGIGKHRLAWRPQKPSHPRRWRR
jgi:hypothetical protein